MATSYIAVEHFVLPRDRTVIMGARAAGTTLAHLRRVGIGRRRLRQVDWP
jgi:hypothetical protein